MDDDSFDNWVSLGDRPEWKDVIPIPQNDGPYSVVAIAYSDKYREVYDYLRGIIKLNEKSERALKLTEYALSLNASNYSVWQFRRDIIKYLNKDIQQELAYTEQVMEHAEKNYQVWHHRRVLVELSQDPSEEDRVTTYFLRSDAKNYHAWQHRQWYCRVFNLFEGELDFVNELLDDDLRNNSAWNQRYFVLNHTTEWNDEVLQKEVTFTLAKIAQLRRNESSWNYLRGIMFHAGEGSTLHAKVRIFCEDLYDSGERSPYLLAYIIDMCADALERKVQIDGLTSERAMQLCDVLGSEVDEIRCQYWAYMKSCIASKVQ